MRKKKCIEMSRSEMEAELQVNAKTLRNLEKENPTDIKEIDQELTKIKSKIEQITKLYIDRQSKHDIYIEKLKFYRNLAANDKKRVRPKTISFCHSSKTKKEIADTFQSLAEAKNDLRFTISAEILNNNHLENTEDFEKLIQNGKYNICILKSIQLRKQIHENYEQIRQLNEALYTSSLPDPESDDPHNSEVQKLTKKLDSVRDKHMKLLHEHALYRELLEKKENLQKDVDSLLQRKNEIDKENDKRKLEQEENEKHLFEFQLQLAEAVKSQLQDQKEDLTEKLTRLGDLRKDIVDQSHEKEEFLNDLRDDFDLINGQFKEILESCPSDPFDDPSFVKLLTGHSEGLPTFSIDTTSLENEIADLESQVSKKNEELDELKRKMNDLQTAAVMSFKLESDTESVDDDVSHIQFSGGADGTNKNEIVVFAGECTVERPHGARSAKAKVLTKAFGMESECMTRLSHHVRSLNAVTTFFVENGDGLKDFAQNSRGVVEILLGDELIGTTKLNFSPLLNGKQQFASVVTVRDHLGAKIGTLRVEIGSYLPLI